MHSKAQSTVVSMVASPSPPPPQTNVDNNDAKYYASLWPFFNQHWNVGGGGEVGRI